MVYFTEQEVKGLLNVQQAVGILRQAFTHFAAGRASHQPRRRLFLDTGAVLHSMTGAVGKYFGTKVYTTHPKHGAYFTVLLYDAETARPLAQYEANWLGQIRTGAVSGLATDLLTPPRAVTVGCIGSGFQARSQVEAVAAVRNVASVAVWSRRDEKRNEFAREVGDAINVPVRAAASAEDATEGVDILITATYSKDPVIDERAIGTSTLVLAMGSNHPQRRELPGELVRRSRVVVEDKEACRIEAGDLLLAVDPAEWESFEELKTLVANPLLARATTGQTTIFKSVGIGLEDVAVAGWLYEQKAAG
jgi:alanine dehydrogenase